MTWACFPLEEFPDQKANVCCAESIACSDSSEGSSSQGGPGKAAFTTRRSCWAQHRAPSVLLEADRREEAR